MSGGGLPQSIHNVFPSISLTPWQKLLKCDTNIFSSSLMEESCIDYGDQMSNANVKVLL